MELLPVAAKWENIGTVVKIKSDKLDNIKKENNNSQHDCLREMLKTWVKQVNPSPTWCAMADALEKLELESARTLRKKYCGI